MTQIHFPFLDDWPYPADGFPPPVGAAKSKPHGERRTRGRRETAEPWRCPECGLLLMGSVSECLRCKVVEERNGRLRGLGSED